MDELHRLMAAIDVAQREADAALEAWKTMLLAHHTGALLDPAARHVAKARLAAADRAYADAVGAFNDARSRLCNDGGMDRHARADAEQLAVAAP
jgi:hypothetical protein